MSETKVEADKRKLGWLTAGMLSFFLSVPAWGLDLDKKIDTVDADSTQILTTLGQGKKVNEASSWKTKKKVKIVLLRAHKAHHAHA